ncbi:MAG: zinc-binding dehydrogenase [Candidatus Neomarinimicrobiota bacterium]
MQAIRIEQHGGPEVLRIVTLPDPVPATDQVLVKIRAAALNHLDIWVRRGFPGIPLPLIPGSDGAGEVVATGSAVTAYKPGDQVLIQPVVYCGQCRFCRRGRENFCREFGIFGETRDGTNCEYLLAGERNLRPMPSGLSHIEAAALPLAAMTAYTMLIRRARLEVEDTVLIWGAGSGIGHLAVQIAKWKGCRVIATAGGPAKLEKTRQLGADVVIDHYQEDVAAIVRRETDRQGVDVVFEHVGAATWDTSLKVLAKGGRLVICGATTGARVSLDLRHLFYKQQSLLGSTMGDAAGFDEILSLAQAGTIRAVVDRVFPWTETAEAHAYLEAGGQFGKIVLEF